MLLESHRVNKRAHNAKVPVPASYKGLNYVSFTDLYTACGNPQCVSIDTFRNRIWAAWKNESLTESRIDDALNLSNLEYRAVYGKRVSWIELDGEQRDLSKIYSEIAEEHRVVSYAKFRSRIRSLERRLDSLRQEFGPNAALNQVLS